MAFRRPPDHEAAIGEFLDMLEACTMQATCGRSYVLVAKLTKWLRSKVGYTIRASRLLQAAYRDRAKPGLPITAEQLIPGEHYCCLIVFSILLKIGAGQLVHTFQRAEIVDGALPIDLRSLKIKLAAVDSNIAEELISKFDEMQWRFCAVKFDLNISRDYVKNRVIPICRKERINSKGGTAQLWQIEVQEEFVGHKLREVALSSRYDDPKDDFGYRFQFALKTFGECNRKVYVNERDAFHGLRNHEGMVRYLADYGHKEIRRPQNSTEAGIIREREETIKTTYNILLEYGESDLDEFFAARLPPVLETEVEAFWKALFEVADAIEGIHNLKTSTDGVVQEYHGWHADIKPDNILSVQGKFKLADPGFAMFVQKTDKVPKETLLGGTETYGAPERHPRKRGTLTAVPQTIDTWSLGCVFSIAATWVVLGHQGIQQFSKMREKAVKKIMQEQESSRSLRSLAVTLNQGNYFHNGRDVLTDVRSWHELLRSALRKTDTITGQVLDLVDRKMLLGNVLERLSAKDICLQLRQISAQTQQHHRMQIPESIMEALLEVDEEAPSKFLDTVTFRAASELGQSLTVAEERRARKSKLQGFPLMKTTHRSEYLKSALAAQNAESEISETTYDNLSRVSQLRLERALPYDPRHGPLAPDQFHTPKHPGNIQAFYNNRPYSGSPGTSTTLASFPHLKPRKSTANAFQNVFQAREAIEKRKHNLLRKKPKDELLSRYFCNRDIIFLVDNAESMKDFWYEANYLLETLVMKASGQDENGMDLIFTSGPIKVENRNGKSDFLKAMKNERAQPKPGIRTDMRKPLGNILSKYLEELKPHSKEKFKNLTLIVLTDGVWEGMRDKDEVNQKIVSFVQGLRDAIGDLKDRPVSIEFIQFGNDADASYRLQRLDNDMKWEGIPDIIDTEPSSGDINKMLLGSFVEEYDEEDEVEPVVSGSPPAIPNSPEWMEHSQPVQQLGGMTRASTVRSFQHSALSPKSSPPHTGSSQPPSRAPTWQDPYFSMRSGGE